MKNKYIFMKMLLALFFIGATVNLNAQDLLREVEVKLVSVEHNFQCCNDQAGTCNILPDRPEPRWNYTIMYGSMTVVAPPVNLGNGVECGVYPQNITLLPTTTLTCLESISIEIESWEDDAGSDISGTDCFTALNCDDNYEVFTSIVNLNGQNEGVVTNFEVVQGNGYITIFSVEWNSITPDVDPIASVCSGELTTLSIATLNPIFVDYHWYDGCYVSSTSIGAGTGTGSGVGIDVMIGMEETITFDPLSLINSMSEVYVVGVDVDGCYSEGVCVTIPVITTSPTPIVDDMNPLVCIGETVSLNVTSGLSFPGNSFHWYNGADLAGTGPSVGASFTTGTILGLDTISVAEWNGVCYGEITNVYVGLQSVTSPPIVTDTIQTCPNGQVTLTATTGGPNGSFIWYDVIDLSNSVSTLTPPLPDNPVGYCFWVTETDPATGCQSLPAKVVVTTDLEIQDPTAPDVTICEGESTSLIATSNSSTSGSFFWYNDALGNDLAYAGNPFNTQSISVSTTYYVVENINGCLSNPVAVNILVDPKPAPPVGMNGTTCSGTDGTFTVADAGGSIQWYSDAGGINTISASSSSYTMPALFATTTIYAGETNAFGCMSDLTPVTVTILPLPSAPSITALELCEGTSGTLTATIGAFDGVITWYNSNGDILEVDGVLPATAEFDVSADTLIIGSNIYYVSYTNTNGCESTWVTVSVNVTEQPAAPTIGGVTVCEGNYATFNAGQGTFHWYLNAGDMSPYYTGQSFTSPSPVTATTSFFVSQEANGCESDKTEVMANLAPNLITPMISSNDPVCQGADVTLSLDDAVDPDYIYTWTNPSGSVISNGPTVIFTTTSASLDSGPYQLEIESMTTGCTTSSTILVEVFSAPQSAPLFSNSPVCNGDDIVLTTSVVTGATYMWSGPGIVNTVSTTDPNYTVTNATALNGGTYTVSITTTGGCDPQPSTTEVIVTNIPVAPTTTDTTVCEGANVILSDNVILSGTGTLNYYHQGSSISPIIGTGLDIGTYIFNVTESINGCESSSALIQVEVLTEPNAPITLDLVVCEDESYDLTAIGSGTLTWTEEDGTPVPNPNGLSQPIEGIYAYYVSQSDGTCESEASSLVVTVISGSFTTPSPETSTIEICQGESTTLFVTGSGTGDITYYEGSTEISPNVGPFEIADTYIYTATEGNGTCESVTPAIITVIVHEKPTFLSDITDVDPLCEGETLTIDAPATNPSVVTYLWTSPNGDTTSMNPIVIPNITEEYQGPYSLVVTNMVTSCTSEPKFVFVQVNEIPSGIIASNSGVTCEGGTVNLTATGIFGATYQWVAPPGSQLEGNPTDAVTQNPVITNVTDADMGIYILVVTVGDCVSTVLETFVSVNNGPSISAGQDIEVLQGETAVLQGAGGINYTWSSTDIGYLNSASIANPTFGGAPVGSYTYMVTGYDANLCSNTDEVIVTVVANDNLDIIDLITPNGDGVNDTWKITYLDNLKGYTLKVYARGGIQILETDNYNNDWDGTYEGNDLPDGTYWYVIKSIDGATYKGAITIKR